MNKTYYLKELGELKNGLNFEKNEVKIPCKIIGVADFSDRIKPEYDLLGCIEKSIVPEGAYLEDGDILFVRSNGNKALVGRTMYIDAPPTDVSFSGFCIRFRPNRDIVYPKYLFYKLRSPYCKKQYSYSLQTNITNLSQGTLENVLVDLPDKENQKRIAQVLESIDSKIDCNKKINDNLYKSAETKYNYWFNQLNDGLPAGWIRKSVYELLTVTTGKEDANFSTENGIYPFFTCSSDTLCCDTPAFEGHAVLIAGNGDFNVKHYTGEFNAYQRTYVLIPNDPIYYGAIHFAASQSIQKFKAVSNGSIVKFITKGDIENISIVIPDKKGYLEELNQYLFSIEANNQEINTLTSLRNWLLPLLMNGQVTITN